MRTAMRAYFLGFLLLTVVIGCGSPSPIRGAGERAKTVPVSGRLLYQGKPLAEATVSFLSSDGKVSARGSSDANGQFTLSTYEPNDGAPAGKYTVIVSQDDFEPGPDGQIVAKHRTVPKIAIPAVFTRPSESLLTATVTPDGPNSILLELKSR